MRVPLLSRLWPSRPVVSVIRLQGAIGIPARHGAAGLSDAGLALLLERAFRRGKPVAVSIALNSPGGSPVQSALIAARIRRLAEETNVPVHAFVEDVAASGGYWLATAADTIWADDSSVLGSIGVISAGFGFADLIQRHGIERRVHTAGRSKSWLDPFRPETPEDVARLNRLLEPIHESFKAQVRARRGDRLAADRDLFNGEVWVGSEAVALGLADGIGHLEPTMRGLFGDRVRFRNYSQRVPFLRRFGISAEDFIDAAAARASYARLTPGG
ncbi:S49 family peptidase [Paracoccus sanguinis]|uniref:Serine protease SohB n=1 Tax=Paracoccus sanguinis TaxID=1545044 RepID=A0A1H2U9W2_9RHOB|nr:S49 family peptidase [Paracoccus sanguinis]KGJ14323.1 multidrug transporter [Paracoccus sanguinis]SDW52850.1 serine protease SohB [Paracoccus sanguinis]